MPRFRIILLCGIAMTKTELLSISHLTFTYLDYGEEGQGHAPLFRDLNLLLEAGSLTVVAGAPDTGKTSLSRIIAGLVPRYSGGSMSGRVMIASKDISRFRPQDLIEEVGSVFHNPDEQLLTNRVDSEIAFPLEALGLPREELARRVEIVLDSFRLRDMAARNPAGLSGGEKKRLLCAVLMAVDPGLWVMDETIDEMDRDWQRRLLDMLLEKKKTILLFSSKLLDIHREYGADLRLLSGGGLIDEPEELNAAALREGLLLPEAGGFSNPIMESDLGGEKRGQNPDPVRAVGTGGPTIRMGMSRGETNRGDGDRKETGQKGNIILSAENLAFTYPENEDFRLRVDHLELREGEVLSLSGPNGCGKSTMARLLCGLLEASEGEIRLFPENGRPKDPTAGKGFSTNTVPETEMPKTVRYGRTGGRPGNRRSRREDLDYLKTSVAYIFQNPDYQIFLPTVREELAFGLKELGLEKDAVEERVLKAIELFRLPGPDSLPSMMSYGSRKRLQAATYWLLDRRVCILDEADSGLSLGDFADTIRLFHDDRRGIIVITHNEELARRFTDRIVLMEGGVLK
jgi:energy-coupling factor transporter ATP-binding protein EcfA2